ncbi:hypothetical protein NC796_22065 [Aliifodinibius sp. S!AR15-10]|uniref:hypothetical protein n=1 Tax=Aliifodinibius sp. S!AR15-10 TaxID=2950437 RepID=UPI0028586B33|nr:hypothetical protein [Aliifodinibius sp. S!AR15-10]MDR8393855.1 hypothetical protein [Aliifodinibius sp. S!AR15-10]
MPIRPNELRPPLSADGYKSSRKNDILETKLIKNKVVFEESTFRICTKNSRENSGAFSSDRLALTTAFGNLGMGWIQEPNNYQLIFINGEHL